MSTQQRGSQTIEDAVSDGDRLRVHIPNPAPIGPNLQSETFVVETVEDGQITGTDPRWNDTIRVTRTEDGLRLRSGGKSGGVKKIQKMPDTHHLTEDKETTIWRDGSGWCQ